MAVLVACEESQRVTIELRKRGIEAFSCDILSCSGGQDQWHIKKDVIELLDMDWSMILAFPPCTHLCSSGARWWKEKRENGEQQKAIDFFMKFVNNKCSRIAIENPIGIMSTVYRKPDQIIHPWMFGEGEIKSTCLWLKNIPYLQPTNIVEGREARIHKMSYCNKRSFLRSKTYKGIAIAMAEQWGKLVC